MDTVRDASKDAVKNAVKNAAKDAAKDAGKNTVKDAGIRVCNMQIASSSHRNANFSRYILFRANFDRNRIESYNPLIELESNSNRSQVCS